MRIHLPSGLSYEHLRRTLSILEPTASTPPGRTPAPDVEGTPGPAIDGLIVDETITKIGRDFYDVFYSAWEAPPGATGFTIKIVEQPAPGLGTRVFLLLDEERLFQLQLQPRYEVVEELAQQAAAYTRRELARRHPAEMPAAAGSPAADTTSNNDGN